MHICYLTIDYHSNQAGGGIASYLTTITQAMARAGQRVTIITLGRGNAAHQNGRVKVVEVAAPSLHWYLYRGLPLGKWLALPARELEWSYRLWAALLELNRQEPIDLIESGELAMFWRTFLPTVPPVVVRGHGNAYAIKKFSGQQPNAGDWLSRHLELAGIRRALAITAVSRFQARELSHDLNCSPDFIKVIPNPVDPVFLSAATHSKTAAGHAPLALYTGRIEYRKGTLALLKSVPYVAGACPQAQYVIAGGHHNSISLQTLNQTLDRDNIRAHVKLLGHIPWPQLVDWYRRAAVFVMPSYYETFGISVIEAMAFGLPVVATRAGGLPEVVEDGVTGLLVPPGDSHALGEAIIRLFKDAGLRQRMGQAGRERVLAKFTAEKVAQQTLALYEKVRSDA